MEGRHDDRLGPRRDSTIVIPSGDPDLNYLNLGKGIP